VCVEIVVALSDVDMDDEEQDISVSSKIAGVGHRRESWCA
jgi:hypothetical protein